MTASNLDHTNLSAAAVGGLVREDVMEKIWLIDRFPLPLTDLLSKDTSGNQLKEWTLDALGTPATDNAVIDGADIDQNDSVIGTRRGNYHQTSVKEIQISTRANASNSIGRAGSVTYQISRGQQRLRRDVEAQMCTGQASLAGDGTAAAGISAGLNAQIATNTVFGATGVDGGWDGAGIFDAPTAGTAVALSFSDIKDVLEAIYTAGGNTECLMSIPRVIRNLSEFMFSSSAQIATMQNHAQGENKERGSTAYSSSNVLVSEFGQIVKFLDNRLMQPDSGTVGVDAAATMYFLDPKYLRQSFLTGYRTEPLAKTGLSEKRLISVDYSLLITSEEAQGAIRDINVETPVLAVPA